MEINHLLKGAKCQNCGKYHDMIVFYKGKYICINCYYKFIKGGNKWNGTIKKI